MSTMLDELIITVMDEDTEEPCARKSIQCPRVAIWTMIWQHAGFLPCENGDPFKRNYCQPCFQEFKESQASIGLGAYCGKCEQSLILASFYPYRKRID